MIIFQLISWFTFILSIQDSKPSDASSAPIAQLLTFHDRYNEHLNSGPHSGYPRGSSAHAQQEDLKHSLHRSHGPRPAGIFHPAHHHPYTTTPQYQYAMYPGVKPDRRYHYDPPLWLVTLLFFLPLVQVHALILVIVITSYLFIYLF